MEKRKTGTGRKNRDWGRKGKLCLYAAVLYGLCAMAAGCKSQAGFYVNQQETAVSEETSGKGEASETTEDGERKDGSEKEEQPALEGQGSPEESGSSHSENISSDSGSIYVQVSGAVRNPGVYALPAGSRIFEAVALAGGLTEEADLRILNQALPVTDGQMIYVYALGEEPVEDLAGHGAGTGDGDGGDGDGRVNLNTASLEQLMTLPGIGQAKAEAIVSYREKHGSFSRIEDIMELEGIKEGVFSKIEDRIKVD